MDTSIEFLNSHVSSASEKKHEEPESITAKVILIGDSSVGKTSILFRFMQDEFMENPNITLGLELSVKKVKLECNEYIILNIWDSAGQEKYRSLTYHFYRGVNGILLVFDINNEKSIKNLYAWLNQIFKHAPENVDIVLIGNKSDGEQGESIWKINEDLNNILQKYRLNYFETSAKTGKNIHKAFNFLAELIKTRTKVESILRKESTMQSPKRRMIHYDKKKEDPVILQLKSAENSKSSSSCCEF